MSWSVVKNRPRVCGETTESLPAREKSMMNAKPPKLEFIATAHPGTVVAESSHQSHFVPTSITKLSFLNNLQAGDSR